MVGILLAVGGGLLISPQMLSHPIMRRRNDRLEQLRNGAEENYLDERRALESYGWIGGQAMWRVLGALLLLVCALSLLPPVLPSEGP